MTPPEQPPELPPEPVPEPPPEPEPIPEPPPEPVSDEELPPPPSDMTEMKKQYPPIKTKKSGAGATLRRAITIFEKDLRTMAKHGLVSAVILLIFLGVVFTIMSFAMSQAMRFDIGDMGEGDGEGPGTLPGSTDHIPPVADAGSDRTVSAGTVVTLDASGSTDNEGLFYFLWNFEENGRDVELYGEAVTYTFYAAGHYEVHLVVVDTSWNMDETNISVQVDPLLGDSQQPMANAGTDQNINVGTTLMFNGTGSTDNVGVVNWTWMFRDYGDRIDKSFYGAQPSYRFDNTGTIWVQLVVRDAAGNTAVSGIRVEVQSVGDNQWPNAELNMPHQVNVGDTVGLDATGSWDNQGIVDYIWFVKQNATTRTLHGQTAEFVAEKIGMYEVLLVVEDSAGNVATADGGVLVYPADVDVEMISWDATPFGTDVSFNLLTYAYGIALLASVIFIGGLFAKGFTHEISKGTIKVLFFGPISVTTMIFSKLLYPIVVGPIFIFPLVLFSLSMFNQSPGDIFFITLVAYLLCVVTMVSAAYGSCIVYAAAKKMVVKPSIVSRIFLYVSLLLTLTVFEWSTFVFDNWLKTDTWGSMYDSYHGIATISPFHQGGVFLSNQIMGTAQTPDFILLAIPAVLIVLGVFASRRLYSDIFSRE